MNSVELKKLIEKYYSGESTEEEESTLRELFKNGTVPEGFDAEKAIFGYYDLAGEIPEPSIDFESGIISGLDVIENKPEPNRLRKYFLPYMSVAAGLLILAGTWFFFIRQSEPKDTFSDPAIAYAETMKILVDVSARMNRGTRALEPVRKMDEITVQSLKAVDKSTDRMGKNLRNLNIMLESLNSSDRENNENKK